MKRGEFQDAFVDSMREMHDEGREWLFMSDIGKRVTSHDVRYVRRYQQINRVLSLIGIHRPDEPTKIADSEKLYPTADRLKREGLIETEWQFPDAPEGEQGRMQYRLVTDPEVQQMPQLVEQL